MNMFTTDFNVTESMVEAFASITGDRSALHMNTEFARRSRYRQRLVHGMLPIASLALIQDNWLKGSIRFTELNARFLKPLRLEDRVRLHVEISPHQKGIHEFRATWQRLPAHTTISEATGSFRIVLSGDVKESSQEIASFIPRLCEEALVELDQGFEALDGRCESFTWRLRNGAVDALVQDVIRPMREESSGSICPNLIATLMMSPLVGMRLPGRRATFLGFKLKFNADIVGEGPYELAAKVQKVLPAAELMKASIEILHGLESVATGHVDVMVNAPYSQMPGCLDLTANSVDIGLKGKVIVVVGASRGIGETSAKLLALLGARVTLTYHRGREDADKIVADIREHGGVAHCAACDVRDDAQVASLMRAVEERDGRIDVLVNCAVHDFSPMAASDCRWEDFLLELEVSLKGLHTTCQTVIPIMQKTGRGKIINFSSVATSVPVAGQSRYITAKSAVEGYSISLARELAACNIQVNLVIPSMTETDLIASIPSNYRGRLSSTRAMPRHVSPAEVAQAVAFLASEWSNAMSGQAIVLNLAEPPFA